MGFFLNSTDKIDCPLHALKMQRMFYLNPNYWKSAGWGMITLDLVLRIKILLRAQTYPSTE
ncbi:hypothetical protein THF1C08_50143 [Vibrio jasicida]|uniref:Transposase DDE domain-containing protein n=1 Tax=Vibrio jasicida TaxID=766224 RepID=A0AAU9QTP9_9VIBR|nr:hypothetical protein THF1C08_50143 [Vibrio jasicida]CAH1601761.1 hypothetical protein THF1A12_50204 [Vibrio jasicida]